MDQRQSCWQKQLSLQLTLKTLKKRWEIPVCTQDHTAFDTMHQARETKEIMERMVED
jgi:hypothetical protein